jgi:hypothetical protein
VSTATHRNIDLVVAALAAGGADPSRVARLRVLPDAVTTAAAAAAALVQINLARHPAAAEVERAREARARAARARADTEVGLS